LFEVVFAEQVFDLVDGSRAELSQTLAQAGQLPVFPVPKGWPLNATHTLYRTALQEPPAVDPKKLAKGVGVATVGLLLGTLLGLDQDQLTAAVLRQQLHQPVVEATDL